MQLFGKSAKYAIQAIRVVLTRPAGELTSSTTITQELAGSPTYIGKVLQTLVKRDILGSRKGARGGFYLKRPPNEVTLWEVVAPFEDMAPDRCPIDGDQICTKDPKCGMHSFWDRVRGDVVEKLKATTLLDLHRSYGVVVQKGLG